MLKLTELWRIIILKTVALAATDLMQSSYYKTKT